MTVKERLKIFIDHLGMSDRAFGRELGLSETYIGSMRQAPSPEMLLLIEQHYPSLNMAWLMTGKLPMLLNEEKMEEKPNINYDGVGVPYYDIYVSASFVEGYNDVKEIPDFYINFKPFNNCDAFMKAYGDSMEPTINHNDVLALQRVKNLEYIQYGEKYLVITDSIVNNMRTVKRIRKHPNNPELIILEATNPIYDPMEVPRTSILGLYLVRGKMNWELFLI